MLSVVAVEQHVLGGTSIGGLLGLLGTLEGPTQGWGAILPSQVVVVLEGFCDPRSKGFHIQTGRCHPLRSLSRRWRRSVLVIVAIRVGTAPIPHGYTRPP